MVCYEVRAANKITPVTSGIFEKSISAFLRYSDDSAATAKITPNVKSFPTINCFAHAKEIIRFSSFKFFPSIKIRLFVNIYFGFNCLYYFIENDILSMTDRYHF